MVEQRAAGRAGVESGYAVEWFRPDLRRRIYKAWGLGSVLVSLGATLGVVLYSISALSMPLRIAISALAIMTTAGGPVVVLLSAFRALSDETVLILRSDGIAYSEPNRAFFAAWGDVVDVAYEAERDTLIVKTDEVSHHLERPRFIDVAPRELVDRIRKIQRKALMGLLEA